jgi:hypothetical protein
MSVVGWEQIGLLALFISVLVKPLGGYLARIYAGERTMLQPILGPVEAALYRLEIVGLRALCPAPRRSDAVMSLIGNQLHPEREKSARSRRKSLQCGPCKPHLLQRSRRYRQSTPCH